MNVQNSLNTDLGLSLSAMLPKIPGLDLESLLKFTIEPNDTQAILDVQKTMLLAPQRSRMITWTQDAVEKNENFMKLFNERYIPELPTNLELIDCPEFSLGRAIGKHLISNNIQLDFSGFDLSMFYLKDMNILTYLAIRGIRTHDIVHSVLGLGVTPIDEYAVASFTLAQFRSPYHMVLVSSGYIHTAFYQPEEIPKFLNTIHKFYNLGLNSEFILGYRFEDNLDKPLSEVRKELGLPLDL